MLDAPALAAVIRDAVSVAVAKERTSLFAEFERRLAALPVPKDGKDGAKGEPGADGRDGFEGKSGADGLNGKDGREGADGKSVDISALFAEIGASVTRAVDALPKAKDGRDGVDGKDGRDGADGKNGIDGKEGAPGADGEDGASGVNGKDGADGVNGKDGANGLDGKDGVRGADGDQGIEGKAGADGVNGQDGAPGVHGDRGEKGMDGADGLPGKDGADGINGRDGSDGINGKDGADGINGRDGVDGKNGADGLQGKDGKSVEPLAVAQMIRSEVDRAVAAIPAPTNGENGTNGRDGKDGLNGFALDDIDLQLGEDGRTVTFTLRNGNREVARTILLPIPIDRGVYKYEGDYSNGDGVTYGGSFFIAKRDKPLGTPGESSDWRLAVKRGKDGKDAAEVVR